MSKENRQLRQQATQLVQVPITAKEAVEKLQVAAVAIMQGKARMSKCEISRGGRKMSFVIKTNGKEQKNEDEDKREEETPSNQETDKGDL